MFVGQDQWICKINNIMEKQKFISNFEHVVVFGKDDAISIVNPNNFQEKVRYLVQYTSNDAELGAKVRILINNTYGK